MRKWEHKQRTLKTLQYTETQNNLFCFLDGFNTPIRRKWGNLTGERKRKAKEWVALLMTEEHFSHGKKEAKKGLIMFESSYNQTSIIWLQTLWKKKEVQIGEPVANRWKGLEWKRSGSKRDHILNTEKNLHYKHKKAKFFIIWNGELLTNFVKVDMISWCLKPTITLDCMNQIWGGKSFILGRIGSIFF